MRRCALVVLVLGLIGGSAWATPTTGSSQGGTSGDGTVTIDAFNDDIAAAIDFNDGAGGTGSVITLLTQFAATYEYGNGDLFTFLTFCIDLEHEVSEGQTYAVDVRDDLGAFTNGAAMAFVYQNYGMLDLTNNPIAAAAVQLTLWDLSLDDHTPTTFGLDSDGTYSSGDPQVFSVNFCGAPDAGQIASLTNQYLESAANAAPASSTGWLDAGASGSAENRGQSLLIPSIVVDNGPSSLGPAVTPTGCKVPEPASIGLLLTAFLLLSALRPSGRNWARDIGGKSRRDG